MQLCNLLMSCVAGSVPQGAPWLQQLSPQGGCIGPLDACHGGTGGDFQGWHCHCPQHCLPSHGMWIQCWFPSHCLQEQFPLQMQPLQNSTAWQECGLATPLPFPSSVSKSPGLVTLERSKDLPQGHASSAKALSLLLLATSPVTAGKLMQEWLVLK